MDNKRDAKWDNVKLILIILVVVGHVADYYMSKSTIMYIIRFYIYIFHMPAFLFVSGLFSKRVVREI